MTNRFSEKTAKVVIVDPSGPVRQMMTDVVRSLDFGAVEGKATLNDLLEHLEVETVDWAIIPLAAEQEVNALHILSIISQVPALKHTRVSFLLEEEETYVLPIAFQLGLFTWHTKPFTKDSLKEALSLTLARLAANDWNETKVTAQFIREFTQTSDLQKDWLSFERKLLDLLPGDSETMLSLARAQQANDLQDDAKATLGQLLLLDPKQKKAIDDVAAELFGSTDISTDKASETNVLGLNRVIVVDGDETVTKELEQILTDIGVSEVITFQDGESAWEYLSSQEEPDLILHEWRIQKLTGPLFIQKIRNHGFFSVPLIVVSSLITKNDKPLLREMSVASVIDKPVMREDFLKTLVWTIQQDRTPSEHKAIEMKIRSLLAAKQFSAVETLKMAFFAEPGVQPSRKHFIEAEYLYAKGQYKKARNAAVEALKDSGDALLVLNLLGKIFMRLGEFEASLKCFQKAQNMSPKNIERLCSIAEVHTELGNDKEASSAIEEAEYLDPTSDQVVETKAKVALAQGDRKTATEAMRKIESLSTLLGYMNNKAVAMARCGKNEDALVLYENTFMSIPDERADLIAIVKYNMALALIRSDDLEKAKTVLEEVQKINGTKVQKKSASLNFRVKQAVTNGTTLELKTQTHTQEAEDEDDDYGVVLETADIVANIAAEAGEICCFKLFYTTDSEEPRIGSLLSNPPRFQLRDAIEREEAHGAEKTNRAS